MSKDATAFKQCKCEPLFAFVKDQKTGKIKIVVGNNLVSKKTFDEFKQAEAFVARKPYELIINTACLFMHFSMTENKQDNEKENEKTNA